VVHLGRVPRQTTHLGTMGITAAESIDTNTKHKYRDCKNMPASKSTLTLVGLALAVIGIGLEYWAYQMSDSLGSQLSRVVTGADTDKVIMLYIGGAASFVVGIYLLVRK
jgi:hypothetical protein